MGDDVKRVRDIQPKVRSGVKFLLLHMRKNSEQLHHIMHDGINSDTDKELARKACALLYGIHLLDESENLLSEIAQQN